MQKCRVVHEGFFLGLAEGEDLGSVEDTLKEPLLDGFGVGLERLLPFGVGKEAGD